MKKIGGALLLCVLAATILPASSAEAAACSNVSSFGAVTLEIPKLPALEDRAVWVRLDAPNPDAHVLVQVNEDMCLQVGGYEQTPGQWSWQTQRTAGDIQPVIFQRTEGNTLKVIGVADGIKIDRVVVTKADCVPQDFGGNCQAIQAVRDTRQATELPPPTSEPVSGEILLSQTPQKYQGSLQRLAYIVNGTVIQDSKTYQPFDTTRIENGKHQVEIETTLDDGQVILESTVIEVNNPENAFSPVVRWVRQHKTSLSWLVTMILVTLLLVASARIISRYRTKRRERTFHGF